MGVLNMANPATWVDRFRPSPCSVNVGLFEDRIRRLPGADDSVSIKADPVCVCGHRQTDHWPPDTGDPYCNAVYRTGDLVDTSDAMSVDDDGFVYCECRRFSLRL